MAPNLRRKKGGQPNMCLCGTPFTFYAADLMEKGYRCSPLEAMTYELLDSFDRNTQTGSVETYVRATLDGQFR
jgi:hypothetical protein